MSKHTPGPWHIAEQGISHSCFEISGANGTIVVSQMEEPCAGEAGVERLEDAQLIAAAPELYESLKEFLSHKDPIPKELAKKIWERALYAIAKAEGK